MLLLARCLLCCLLICCCPVVYSEFIRVDECLLETAAAGRRVDETVGATNAPANLNTRRNGAGVIENYLKEQRQQQNFIIWSNLKSD